MVAMWRYHLDRVLHMMHFLAPQTHGGLFWLEICQFYLLLMGSSVARFLKYCRCTLQIDEGFGE